MINNLRNEGVKISKKKGSIGGAVALIIGTSIGTGILALPMKTSPAVTRVSSRIFQHFNTCRVYISGGLLVSSILIMSFYIFHSFFFKSKME